MIFTLGINAFSFLQRYRYGCTNFHHVRVEYTCFSLYEEEKKRPRNAWCRCNSMILLPLPHEEIPCSFRYF